MHYYGTRLSENISRREPEGYLLCLNVPVARTGTQEYLPEELGLSPGPPGMVSGNNDPAEGVWGRSESPQLIQVHRPPEEVFSPETIASFEGMPVTNDHPPDGVDIGNIRALQKGHAHNVRRGTGEESDLLLADLIITDPVLIDLILDGKREISCGYTYELHEENGTYIQRKIRGNHVAVVDAGRAGHRVSIKDQKPNRPERSTRIMKKSLSKILARMAKDGDIETVAEIIEEMIELETAEPVAEVVEEVAQAAAVAPVAEAVAAVEPEAVIETPEATIVVDESTLADIVSRLDKLIELLTPAPAATDDDPAVDPVEEIAEAVEEAIEAAAVAEEGIILPDEDMTEGIAPEDVAEIVEEILEPVAAVSEVLDPLEDERDPEEQEVLSTGDALRTALNRYQHKLARMPEQKRRRVCADIAARLGRPVGRRGADADYYAAMAAMKRKPARGNNIPVFRRAPLRHDFLPESCFGPPSGRAEPGHDRIGMGLSGTETRYGFLYEAGPGGDRLGAGRFFRRRRVECSTRQPNYLPVTCPNIDVFLFLPVALGYWKQHELWDGTYTLDDLLDIAELAEVRSENENRALEARLV